MFLPVLTVAVVCAQFSNHSLGVSGNATTSAEKEPLYSLSLEGSWYVENGFDLYVHVPIGLTTTLIGPSPSGSFGYGQNLVTGGHVGVRYLFLEEHFRPFIGAHLASIVIVKPGQDAHPFGGAGVLAGAEYFVTDTVAIGARAHYDVLLDFLRPTVRVRHNFGASLSIGVFF
jgi:hypothetical protein